MHIESEIPGKSQGGTGARLVRQPVLEGLLKVFEIEYPLSLQEAVQQLGLEFPLIRTTYNFRVLVNAIHFFYQKYLPHLPESEALHELGTLHARAYIERTLAGRVRYGQSDIYGGWNMLQVFLENHDAVMLFGTRQLKKTGRNSAWLRFQDDPTDPYYMVGMLEVVLQRARATTVDIVFEVIAPHDIIYKMSWKDTPLPVKS